MSAKDLENRSDLPVSVAYNIVHLVRFDIAFFIMIADNSIILFGGNYLEISEKLNNFDFKILLRNTMKAISSLFAL